MMSLADFLLERRNTGGSSTDEALAAFLPLLRQVASAHQSGRVAPLQGIEAIRVESNRLWYVDSHACPPVLAPACLQAIEKSSSQAIEIVNRYLVQTHLESGSDTVVNLLIGRRGEPFAQPVYLPGYIAWEHELGHHDALTDLFVLGLILASLTCGFDLNQPEHLATFVRHRRNLFQLNARLHPVLVKAIVRMTELSRHQRPQDTAALLHTLERYREQKVDFEFDLARIPSFASTDRPSRRAMILNCLQQRLFDLSKRNRLLHFRATSQTVNLTWASVPLALDVNTIRPEQLLTWGHRFKSAMVSGSVITLNNYLRFEDALYLTGQLDQIRNEARRDQTEYGFAQLRLVLCFLRWANLKSSPPDRFDSPLVLLPVRLSKSKGIRDLYTLESSGTLAEINPALRFQLKQLYAVELPETVDLSDTALDELYAYLASKIQASEPGITLDKIDKPRINLIHAKAKRRLQQYRRRTRLSGRGVRTYLDIDYSYDRSNYHPLGVQLFQTRISPAEPRLRSMVEESPRPCSQMLPPASQLPGDLERRMYTHVEDEANPYQWEYDLCNVTLGNFHYRKMSLVRDYTVLAECNEAHTAFDAIFSLEPREAAADASTPLPMDERFTIVDCDPTQASAIARARSGKHFIIQGPPGTGKSQTITNLIADYVARGQRVLFVCEKRAAIDVVYHRLHHAGLHELCCLIHDAQEDKKAFIADLKATYEAFQTRTPDQLNATEAKRHTHIAQLRRELAPLERFQAMMTAVPPASGIPLYRLIERVIELRERVPVLTAREREHLPSFAMWCEYRPRIERLREWLEVLQPDGVLAHHPLHLLHERFAALERPLAVIEELLPGILTSLDRCVADLKQLVVPAECWNTLDTALQLTTYATSLSALAEHDAIEVLKPNSERARKLTDLRKRYSAAGFAFKQAQSATRHWRRKLNQDTTRTLLEQAREQEHSFWRIFSPRWWRLRRLIRESYDCTAEPVQPSYTHVLEALQIEHQRDAELQAIEGEARSEFMLTGPFSEFQEHVARLSHGTEQLPHFLLMAHRWILASDRGNDIVKSLAKCHHELSRLVDDAARLLVNASTLSFDTLRIELERLSVGRDELPAFLPCLKELSEIPSALTSVWRQLPLTVPQLEAAIARHTLDTVYSADPSLARFTAERLAKHVARLEPLHDEWHAVNAVCIRDQVCRRFLENVRIASLPHGQLTEEQKEFKVRYNRGRRELEHEFAKTMRYRSIRDLVDDETGLVVRDLKPVWLMSPLSVSDTLPLTVDFDVVIFDEASQVTLEEAVPAIFRARQVLIVGDEMQLPPTSFFASRTSEDDEQIFIEDASGQNIEYDLTSSSLLNHAARNLPSTMLGWHYRSRSESLISFSNAAFYQGRLLTVPEVTLLPSATSELVVHNACDGATNASQLLGRPVSFHFLERGIYDQRRNSAEAQYIAHLVRGILADPSRPTLGIIAFSEAQQDEIEQALTNLARDDNDFRDRLDAEWERDDDGQFVGLLVKNLENIQGDERDVIILSVCYGYGPSGRMLMNFGPINQNGGERRLNVAFSRAKKHMALISSIRPAAITNDYNDGARTLKNYIRYVEALSTGNTAAAQRVLAELNPTGATRESSRPAHIVVEQLARRFIERGYEVARDVGQSDFRCDLAIRERGATRHALGILVDAVSYYQNTDLLERDLLRPRLLRSFNWTMTRLLSKDWLDNPDAEMQRLETLLKTSTAHF